MIYRADGPDPWDQVPEPEESGTVTAGTATADLPAQKAADVDPDVAPDLDTLAGPADPDGDARSTDHYRGRRRRRLSTAQQIARWGTAAIVVTVGVVLIGSNVLARSLSDPVTLPVFSPPPDSPVPAPTGGGGDQPSAPAQESRHRVAAPARSPLPEPTTPEPTTPSPEPDLCRVEVDLDLFQGGFRADYALTNLGEPWDGWVMTFQVSDGVTHEESSSAFFQQDGNTITVTPGWWNDEVDTGETETFGHRGDRTGQVELSGFVVNGLPCTVTTQ